MKKLQNLLKNEDGFSGFDIIFGFFIIFVLIAVFISVVSITVVKTDLDYAANELIRIVEREGQASSSYDIMVNTINRTHDYNIDYDLSVSKNTKLQKNTTFTLSLSTKTYLDSVFGSELFPINVTSTDTGITEKYWK